MHSQKRSRAFLLSFVVTITTLSGLFALLYYSSLGPHVSSLPENLPKYETVWGRYTPPNVLSVAFENVTMLHSINASLPPERVLFRLASPKVSLNNSEVRSVISIVFVSPNATLDIAFLGKPTFDRFSQLLAKEGSSPVNIEDSTLYEVRVNPSENLQLGWIAVIPRDGAIAFSAGTGAARSAISESLNVLYGNSPSILSREDVSQLLYIVGGGPNHIGIQIQNFPGVVRTGEMTFISVDRNSTVVQISYVVKFTDAGTALGQYDAVKSAYLSSHQFSIYANYVKAVEYRPLSSVESAIRMVG